MPSINECLQPYLLSNFDLVTESFTLIAGNEQLAPILHLVEPVDAGRRLLGHAPYVVGDLGPTPRVLRERTL